MSRFYIYGTLPPLEFGAKPEIASRDLDQLFDLNLSSSALKKVYVLKLWVDLSNIYALLQDSTFDKRGNYSKSKLQALIANEDELPSYFFEFFDAHEKDDDRKKHFPELIARYFKEEKSKAGGYLLDFLNFEHDIRVLLAGFRAKKRGLDVSEELQYEDLDDPVVAAVLLQKDRGGKFQFPLDYEDLEAALNVALENPSKLYEEIAKYRFRFYIQYFSNYSFSLEGILAYMMALWILEDFFALNREEGEKYLSNIVERGNVS